MRCQCSAKLLAACLHNLKLLPVSSSLTCVIWDNYRMQEIVSPLLRQHETLPLGAGLWHKAVCTSASHRRVEKMWPRCLLASRCLPPGPFPKPPPVPALPQAA